MSFLGTNISHIHPFLATVGVTVSTWTSILLSLNHYKRTSEPEYWATRLGLMSKCFWVFSILQLILFGLLTVFGNFQVLGVPQLLTEQVGDFLWNSVRVEKLFFSPFSNIYVAVWREISFYHFLLSILFWGLPVCI